MGSNVAQIQIVTFIKVINAPIIITESKNFPDTFTDLGRYGFPFFLKSNTTISAPTPKQTISRYLIAKSKFPVITVLITNASAKGIIQNITITAIYPILKNILLILSFNVFIFLPLFLCFPLDVLTISDISSYSSFML